MPEHIFDLSPEFCKKCGHGIDFHSEEYGGCMFFDWKKDPTGDNPSYACPCKIKPFFSKQDDDFYFNYKFNPKTLV